MKSPQSINLTNWETQLRKGFLELFILNFLKAREFYGYELVRELKTIRGLTMREGTIYPILARLQEDGFVTNQVKSSDNGPPRKYFRLTAEGRKAVGEMNAHWNCLTTAMQDTVVFKKDKNDAPIK